MRAAYQLPYYVISSMILDQKSKSVDAGGGCNQLTLHGCSLSSPRYSLPGPRA